MEATVDIFEEFEDRDWDEGFKLELLYDFLDSQPQDVRDALFSFLEESCEEDDPLSEEE